MQIEILHLIEGAKQAHGLVVIIDVFRAFSTACYAVRNGAAEIIPVGDGEKIQNVILGLMDRETQKIVPLNR